MRMHMGECVPAGEAHAHGTTSLTASLMHVSAALCQHAAPLKGLWTRHKGNCAARQSAPESQCILTVATLHVGHHAHTLSEDTTVVTALGALAGCPSAGHYTAYGY